MSGHVSELPVVLGGRGFTRLLLALTKGFALLGGGMFISMIVLSVISIIGRKLWSAPINGDLEMLQMGTGIAAAAFFPYCTLMGEHLRVEFFTAKLSVRAHSVLDGIANLLLAIAMGLLTWRTSIQVREIYEAGEVSVMRNIPIWIPILCLVPSLGLTALCGLNRALHHFVAKGVEQ
ncbi:MAG: TRAP transporter small permease [Betaproteobacteria bacterium]|nr:TRAP transporter small permease [Betaproteobacteria bacterium]